MGKKREHKLTLAMRVAFYPLGLLLKGLALLPLPLLYGPASLLAFLARDVVRYRRRVVRANLRDCFPELDGRGRYRSTIRLITDTPRSLEPGEITRRYAAALERQIRRCPEAYLWSHNRWRLKKSELK